MDRECNHDMGTTPEPTRIVDDPDGGLDPVLVMQSSRCRLQQPDPDDRRFVEIIGSLDSHTTSQLGTVLDELTSEEHGVVIDLAGVSFCDSAGLRFIEALHDRSAARGQRVWLHDPSRTVRRLIAVVGIDRLDICAPVIRRHRSLRCDVSPHLQHRDWHWDGRTTEFGPIVDDPPRIRLVELYGGREHPHCRRLTIDVAYTKSTARQDGTVGRRRDALFTIRGEFDTSAVIAISDGRWRCLEDVVNATVDLSEVTLITSAGLRVIENAAAVVSEAGGTLVVREPSPIARRVLNALDVTFDVNGSSDTGDGSDGAVIDLDSMRERSRRRLQRLSDSTRRADHDDAKVWVVTEGDALDASGLDLVPAGLASASLQSRGVSWAPIPPSATRVETPTDPLDDKGVDSVTEHRANAILWSALHGATTTSHREDEWAAYRQVNEGFADIVRRSCGNGDTVWIHDYPLMLAPAATRLRRPDLKIGFSLHTCFDDAAMSALDHAREIADSLAACDLVGVQTLGDADQLEAFLVHAGCAPPPIVVSPTSIDPGHIVDSADRAASTTALRELRQRAGNRRLIVSIDDLDHTSAIGERLAAYDLAFRNGVLDPDDVHIVQIVDTRHHDTLDDRALRVEIERLADQLDTTWVGADRVPILETRFDDIEPDTALAILREADIALVTPVCAGMAAQAKEFSVLAEATGGILVLSDRCGAAAELGMFSILVDGAAPESIVNGFRLAATLDAHQRRADAVRRNQRVRRWTADDWCTTFLRQLTDARDRNASRVAVST